MEQEKPQGHSNIYNYFEGATIHNMVINGNMVKNGDEHYQDTSHDVHATAATTQLLKKALERCKQYIWGHAAYSITFCVCRDKFHMEDNASLFERTLNSLGVPLPAGTINSAFSRNPWLKHHIDDWEKLGVKERPLKLRDAFQQEMMQSDSPTEDKAQK